MQPLEFKKAYYIKLGRKGEWEKSSIQENKMRIGWKLITLDDINNGDWSKIRKQLNREITDTGAATRDYNALRHIAESTSEDVWITFHASRLWWCQAGKPTIEADKTSKYRKVAGQWYDCDINGNQLIINQIPGTLSKLQGFRGTACRVHDVESLRRLLNDQPSETYQAISHAINQLVLQVEKGLKLLHWKDFETLVDLLFREAGWRRISVVGLTMKYADIELEEPITGDLYQVQVKSTATLADFETYADQFSQSGFRKLYFVVHTPKGNWATHQDSEKVELILPRRLAQMVMELGLTDWLLKRIR